MFYNCSSLTSLDLSKFNTSNVTDIWGMFWKCSSLKNLDVSNFDISKVEDMSSMFYECSAYNFKNITFNDKVNQTISTENLPKFVVDKGLTWYSSDYSVATVDDNGVVTPVSNGTAVITCYSTETSLEAVCNVTVNTVTYQKGDYNKNNTVDVTDAYLLLSQISKNAIFDDETKSISDLNEDGRVDVTDAYLLLLQISKM
jgi:surface protein